jgi:hypothetical protein
LELKDSLMGDKGIEILYDALLNNDTIEEINFEGCLISSEG